MSIETNDDLIDIDGVDEDDGSSAQPPPLAPVPSSSPDLGPPPLQKIASPVVRPRKQPPSLALAKKPAPLVVSAASVRKEIAVRALATTVANDDDDDDEYDDDDDDDDDDDEDDEDDEDSDDDDADSRSHDSSDDDDNSQSSNDNADDDDDRPPVKKRKAEIVTASKPIPQSSRQRARVFGVEESQFVSLPTSRAAKQKKEPDDVTLARRAAKAQQRLQAERKKWEQEEKEVLDKLLVRGPDPDAADADDAADKNAPKPARSAASQHVAQARRALPPQPLIESRLVLTVSGAVLSLGVKLDADGKQDTSYKRQAEETGRSRVQIQVLN
jgi:hypothetical protein